MTVFVITMGVVYTLFTTTIGTTLASLVLKLSAGLRFRTTFKILGIHYFSVMIVPFVALSGLVYYVKHPTVAYEWVDWTASWTLIWMWTLGALAFSAWQFDRPIFAPGSRNRDRGGPAIPVLPLPHHQACGSAPGGSVS